MKVLFVATVRSHIGQFHMPFIKRLRELGVTVDAAYKDNSKQKQGLDTSEIDTVYEVPFTRTPYSIGNVKAYFKLKKIIENGNYDAVHCHTPMGAVITRLASRKTRKRGMKVIYTAHGFHFYNGASKKNWLIYYNVEKLLSRYTDCLITINSEDYEIAKRDFIRAGEVLHVNGVGVELKQFSPKSKEEKSALREQYGFSDSDFLMIYPADFCFRKNQIMLLKALELIVKKHSNVKLLLPGLQDGADECKAYCKSHNLEGYAEFLGYRRDIYDFAGMCDLSLSSSRQEGLPINLIEALALGNPIVATDVRGNNDVVENGVNGFLVKLNDYEAMADKICSLIENRDKLGEFSANCLESVKKYSVDIITQRMVEIYESLGLIK